MRRPKAWIIGTGVACALLVGGAISLRRSRRERPFDFVAKMPVKFVGGRRPIPASRLPSGMLAYEILIPFDEFKQRLHREIGGLGSWKDLGNRADWDALERYGSALRLTHYAPGFVWKPNPKALGFVWIQEPMNVYPVGFWGGVAWTLTDKP